MMTGHGDARGQGDTAGPMTLLEMISSSWMSQAIYVAARLGIADVLAQGPRTSEEMASAIGAHADSVFRLLRALTTLGLCAEQDNGVFELTPLGSYLRTGIEPSVRSFALHWGGSMWPMWGTLLHSVKTGKSPRALITRKESFESLAQSPDALRAFNDAMTEISTLMAEGLVRGYDFSGIGRIVDVGGGHGELLGAILGANPGMRGVLFDLPHVLEGVRKHLEAVGVAERCETVPGSFFESVPSGADAYLLKSVLHDWNDNRAAVILTNCRRAMAGRGKLLVVERILPERMQQSAEHRWMAASDLGMMVAVSGRERTEADFRALFCSTGFTATRIARAAVYFSVIEGECS
jgi:hypothetical protein